MKKNDGRVRQGLDIYCDAMRQYITQQMELRESGDWFHNRVLNVLHPSRGEEIAEALAEGKDKKEVLEFKDFPEVIRQNRKVFSSNLAGGRRKKSIAVTWMQEITLWRNIQDHEKRGMDDFSDQDADRALDSCARVLSQVDPEAGKKVRTLFQDSHEVGQKLKDEQASHENTKQIAYKAAGLEQQLQDEQQAHEKTRQRLKEVKKLKSKVEVGKQKAEVDLQKIGGTLRNLKDEHKTTERMLKSEVDAHRKTKEKLKSCEDSKGAAERSQKTSDPQVQAGLHAYCEKFVAAKSRNGRRRTIRLWQDKDWFVTHWVGESRGMARACVFAPWKRSDSGVENAGDDSLIDLWCNSEDDAFEKLWEKQQSGEIERWAHMAIEDYERPDSTSDDDIPF